ncbi:MAG: PAS domain-containing protein [Vicingus serpentipes]|nr:PAS domain-containing protein [Vicingus serpentipes]
MDNNQYSIFDNLLEGLQVIDKDWRYVYVNNAVANHGKTTKEVLLGKTMMEVYPGIEKTKMFETLKECMSKKISKTIINEFNFPDGSVGYFELRMQPVPAGILILSLDITEQKNLEVKLKKMNEHLEEHVIERTKELAKALEREKELNLLKSRFVSIASHEFKTPLGAIQISVNVLESCNGPLPEDAQQRIEVHGYIKSSVKSMFEILDEYLTLDKLESNKINSDVQVFDCKDLITAEINQMGIICKEGQKINYIHQGGELIRTDRQLVKSIVRNLSSNAIKYSNDNIEINSKTTKKHIILRVNDKGIGIPRKDQKKLYEKFYRATNTADIHGTGLGLNIVKRYVDLLGGEIRFKSEPAKGTHFEVKIPVQAIS